MTLLDNQQIEIACPNCGTKIKKPLGWFKQQGHNCPGCNALFKTDQFRQGLDKVERSLTDLVGRFGKLGK